MPASHGSTNQPAEAGYGSMPMGAWHVTELEALHSTSCQVANMAIGFSGMIVSSIQHATCNMWRDMWCNMWCNMQHVMHRIPNIERPMTNTGKGRKNPNSFSSPSGHRNMYTPNSTN